MPRTRTRARRAGTRAAIAGLAMAGTVLLAVPATGSAAPPTDGTEDPARRISVDHAHRQMATCTAFFLIAAEATPPTAADRAALEQLGQAADGLVEQMLRLRDEAATRARIEAERQWLMLAIGGSLAGYPRLHDTLAGPCAKIAADPQGHVDGLLDGEAPREPSLR